MKASSKFLKIQGKYNYYLHTAIKGEAPCQSSTLIIGLFSNETKKVPLNFSCKYYRIKNKSISQLSGLNSNIYNLSASDIGCTIKVEVSLAEKNEFFYGMSEIFYGPIQFDLKLKHTLENILAIGGSKFPITIISPLNKISNFNNDCSFLLTNDHIRIIAASNISEEKSVKFKYFLGYPHLMINNNEATQIQMIFKGNEEMENLKDFFNIGKDVKNFEVIFQTSSRHCRDLIISSIRCFCVKNYLINSKSIAHIDNLFENDEKENKEGIDVKFDLITEVENLKKEISHLSENTQEILNEKTALSKEVKAIEDELEKTIQTYTNLINEMKNGNFMVNESLLDISLIGKKEEIEIRKRCKFLEQENKNLYQKIKTLNNQIELLENFNKNQGFFDETIMMQDHHSLSSNSEKQILELQNTNKMLKSQIEELKLNSDSQILEKKLNESKKLNAVLLEEIATFKLSFASQIGNHGNMQNQEIKMLEIKLNDEKEKNSKIIAKLQEDLKKKDEELSLFHNQQQALEEIKRKNNFLENEIEILKNKEKSNIFQNNNYGNNDLLNKETNENAMNSFNREFENLKERLINKKSNNFNADQENIIKLLELEIKHLKLEVENSKSKFLKNEEKMHCLSVELAEEKKKNDHHILEIKSQRHNLETLKAENEFFQNENITLLEDRKKKMEKIITLEAENRTFKSNHSSLSFKNDNNNNNNDIRELRTKNVGLLQENTLLKQENSQLKEKIEKNHFQTENFKDLMKENENLENINEELKHHISDLQFKVNSLTNEISTLKTSQKYANNYAKDYEKIYQENIILQRKIENYKLNELKNSNHIDMNTQCTPKIDGEAQEIIENLQNERKALNSKIESMQKEMLRLQKNGSDLIYSGFVDNEKNFLKKRIQELESEIQLLLNERKNPYNQPRTKNPSRNIFG